MSNVSLPKLKVLKADLRLVIYVSATTLPECTGKQVSSTSLYHSRQCCNMLWPRSDIIDYTVVCFVAHAAAESCENNSLPVSASWV